jgi:hypothetical protein
MFKNRKPSTRPQTRTDYPDGVMVDTERNVYYIRGGKRFRLFSERAFQSWSIEPIRSSEAAVKHIPLAKAPLGFRDGTLIHNMGDGRLYLISGTKRRQITNPDVFERFGWSARGAVYVSQQETDLHPEGEVLS